MSHDPVKCERCGEWYDPGHPAGHECEDLADIRSHEERLDELERTMSDLAIVVLSLIQRTSLTPSGFSLCDIENAERRLRKKVRS